MISFAISKLVAIPARPVALRKSGRVAHVTRPAASMRELPEEEDDRSAQILGGEWSPTLTWSLPSTPVRNTPHPPSMAPQATVHADEEGMDADNLLAGDWDARSCSLVSYEDVMQHFYAMKHPNEDKH